MKFQAIKNAVMLIFKEFFLPFSLMTTYWLLLYVLTGLDAFKQKETFQIFFWFCWTVPYVSIGQNKKVKAWIHSPYMFKLHRNFITINYSYPKTEEAEKQMEEVMNKIEEALNPVN